MKIIDRICKWSGEGFDEFDKATDDAKKLLANVCLGFLMVLCVPFIIVCAAFGHLYKRLKRKSK